MEWEYQIQDSFEDIVQWVKGLRQTELQSQRGSSTSTLGISQTGKSAEQMEQTLTQSVDDIIFDAQCKTLQQVNFFITIAIVGGMHPFHKMFKHHLLDQFKNGQTDTEKMCPFLNVHENVFHLHDIVLQSTLT